MKAARKFTAAGGRIVQVDHGRNLGEFFRLLLARLTKKKYELNFIVGIVSFQLYQKSSNLVMFYLPKKTLKLH